MDEKAKEKAKVQAKKRKEREAVAQKKAQAKAALAAQLAEQRAAAAAIRAQILAHKQAEADQRRAERDQRKQQLEQLRRSAAEQRAHEKQARARAQAARAEQKQRDRAQALAARAAEQQRKREEKLAERSARQEARQTAQAQTLAKKESARAQAAQRKDSLKQLSAVEKEQSKHWGAPWPELFNAWLHIFRQREDVVMEHDSRVPSSDLGSPLDESVSPAQASWMRTVGAVQLSWHAATKREVRGEFSCEPAAVTMDDAWFEQLRLSAKNAFLVGDPQMVQQGRDLLAHTSIPRFTSSSLLLSLLEEHGLEKRMGKALIQWLEEDVQWLFSISATDEGRRRRRLLDQAARSPTAEDTIDMQLVAALNQGPVVDKSFVLCQLKEHEHFVNAGGNGGDFQISARHKLPHVTYEHSVPARGQLNFMVENLTGHKFSGLRLDSANLCGSRCDAGHFSKATLRGACLRYAHLLGAQFQAADLRHADLSHAELAGADFRKADLTGTNFERANLAGANFAGAIVAGTKFAGAVVRGIKY